MPLLDLPQVHPYRSLGRVAPAPVLPVRLLLGTSEFDVAALVDTGAEESLFDGHLLRAAGRDLFAGPEQSFQGFVGAGTVGYRHRVRLQVGGLDLDLEVHFSTVSLSRQVLGRDVLQYFLVGLRERAGELYLAPDPLAP